MMLRREDGNAGSSGDDRVQFVQASFWLAPS